ncbi:MAG: hypothetical protein KAR31_00785 [Candidatus Omnitrophica bacterium]|nr:hypothetical protein [Candidatus Omnitrophota bacterium]
MENFTDNVPQTKDTISEMMISRQAQEVQAAMVIAKKFPRDEAKAYDKIMRSCQRKGLAEQAEYVFPRGGQKVIGASIRLAEAIAQNWGNVDYGILELSNKDGASEIMAYAWDLETNTRVTKIFTVKHWRDTKSGGYGLKDVRDIYEATANFGARRVRACILGIIPGDITEAAVRKCRETIKGAHKTPLEDRFRTMITVFEDEFQVSQKQIEEYLGYGMSSFSENDFIRMQGVYRSLRDEMSKPADFFKGIKEPKEKVPVNDPFKPSDKPQDERTEITTPQSDKEPKGSAGEGSTGESTPTENGSFDKKPSETKEDENGRIVE